MLGQNQFIIYAFLFILKISKTSGISGQNYSYEGCVSVEDKRKVTFDTVEAYQRNNVSFEYSAPNFRGDLVDFNIPTIKVLYNNSFENTYDMWVRGLFLQRKGIYEIQDGAFHSLKCLRTLVLAKNLIKTLRPKMFKGLSVLFTLNLSNNMITSLFNDTFNYVTTLEELDLSHNLIKFIELNTFYKLKLLYALHLSYNKLDVVELEIFKGAKLLKVLDLSYCNMTEFKSVSDAESLLPDLQILDLSHNKLHSELPNIGYPALLVLHLDSNNLAHLNVQILRENCPQLSRFYIDNNHIECEEMANIKRELKSYNVTTTKTDECPETLREPQGLTTLETVFVTLTVVTLFFIFMGTYVLSHEWSRRYHQLHPGQRVAGFPEIVQPAHAVQALQPVEVVEEIPGVVRHIPTQPIDQFEQIEQVRQIEPAQPPIRFADDAV